MDMILRNLLETAILSSIMIVGVICIRKLFSTKLSYKIVSILWILVLLKMMLPFTITSPFHLDMLIKEEQPAEQSVNVNQNENIQDNISVENQVVYVGEKPIDETIEYELSSNENIAHIAAESTFWQNIITILAKINYKLALLSIWLFTSVLVLLSYMIKFNRLNHILNQSNKRNANRLISLLKKAKIQTKTVRNIEIFTSNEVDVPIVYGIFRPKIVIPNKVMYSLSDKKIILILMHEICHIKRFDVLKNMVWLIAKALYWFNPLVYFAYNYCLEDTELICDDMVKNSISKDLSIDYTQSLLDVVKLGRRKQTYSVCVSFCKDKNTLRKRVENMIKPTKKLKSAGITSMLLAIIMVVGCFTTACQPTPEKEIVQNKSNTELDELINSNSSNENNSNNSNDNSQVIENSDEQISQYSTYSDAFQLYNSQLVINIDASVDFQNNSWNIAKASTISFSTEQMKEISSKLTNGQQLYNYTNDKTKQELVDDLISYKKKWAEGDIDDPGSDYDSSIDEFEQKIANAPETLNYTIADFQNPVIYPDSEGAATEMIYLMNHPIKSEYKEYVQFQKKDQSYNISYQKILPELDNYYEVELNDLYDIAYSFLADLGIYDMSIIQVSENNPALLTQEDIDFIGEDNISDKIFYRLLLVRNIDGNTLTYDLKDYENNTVGGPQPAGSEIPSYTPCPQGESISIVITNEIITEFRWTTPLNVQEIVSENVSMKSIDEIMPIFTQYMELNNLWTIKSGQSTVIDIASTKINTDVNSIENMTLEIDTIKLGYMRVKNKNTDVNSYLLVPVWDFYGKTIINYLDGTSEEVDRSQKSYMTINAIDGTVINRYIGY